VSQALLTQRFRFPLSHSPFYLLSVSAAWSPRSLVSVKPQQDETRLRLMSQPNPLLPSTGQLPHCGGKVSQDSPWESTVYPACGCAKRSIRSAREWNRIPCAIPGWLL